MISQRRLTPYLDHQRLLTKLRGYGIEGRILTWIEALLTDRRQRVVINYSRSSWADVTSGIPHGSVLGPMLFICYINDMPSSVQSSIYLFADDAKLYRNIVSDDDPRTPTRPSATGEMVRGMAAAFQLKQVLGHAHRLPKPTPRLHHGRNNTGYNNQREGSWRVRNFRETHRDCCEPGEQNAWTHPSLSRPIPTSTASHCRNCYSSLVRPTRKCSMDSYPETRPNPTRECLATSNELIPELRADTRTTRQILRGPATRIE